MFAYICAEKSHIVIFKNHPWRIQLLQFLIPIIILQLRSKKDNEDNKRWCDFCNQPRRTQEPCWKLHGYLSSAGKNGEKKNDKKKKKKKKRSLARNKIGFSMENKKKETSTGNQEFRGFNKEQLKKLKALLDLASIPMSMSRSLIPFPFCYFDP